MKKVLGALLLFFTFSIQMVCADQGEILITDLDAEIFEPQQRAVIAWNGEEEILLLSTDLYASKPTKVMEVLPLPSEPVVKKGDAQTFGKAIVLIRNKLIPGAYDYGEEGGELQRTDTISVAGELTFHKKIGVQDISVTRVLDSDGFVDWVGRYLKTAGVDNPVIPEQFKQTIGEYLREGFSWFVFDIIELSKNLQVHEAIQYRFASRELFYPLKISGTTQGETSIELLILTPYNLNQFNGISKARIEIPHEPITLTHAEISSLNEEMSLLLGYKYNVTISTWRLQGMLSSFDKDLRVDSVATGSELPGYR